MQCDLLLTGRVFNCRVDVFEVVSFLPDRIDVVVGCSGRFGVSAEFVSEAF